MNVHDRNQRRDRALNLFQAEAREQQLSAIAIRKATVEGERVVFSNEPSSDSKDPVVGLRALGRDAELNILGAHRQLHTARTMANRMAAVDPELARLNAQIDGGEPAPSEGDVIEAEVVEVTAQEARPPLHLNSP